MSLGAALANLAWIAGNLGAARRFELALREPEAAQTLWLRARLARDAKSAFGREHGFGGLRNYADFARRVPLRDWEGFEPWIGRVRKGEPDVLGQGRVTHLAPTSGTSGARKLIPFTAGLQEGFSTAVGAWMFDLAKRRPGLLGGPSYWAVSPLSNDDEAPGAVPVGFADDAEYLGGMRAWLVRRALAAPAELRHERDLDRFWRRTLVCLLQSRDLRLISVWHPSFMELLLEAAERHWDDVCAGVKGRARRSELRRLGPRTCSRWWPALKVISCWGEQAAEPGRRSLERRFPGVLVQAKGLLATEAAVTIPWDGKYPLAVTSHFFEFVDEQGGVRRAHQLEQGRHYEVVVTNGGGLWRYRLGDIVECAGRLAATPTLRFLGRAGNVGDLRGEKLSEAFAGEMLRGLWTDAGRPDYAVLRARDDESGAGYELQVSAVPDVSLAGRLDEALSRNPHYALARRLGQLKPARVALVPAATEKTRLREQGGRLGDMKPVVFIGAPVREEGPR